MASLNKVMLIGNLGRDPEIKAVGASKMGAFPIAVTEKFKDKSGQQQEKTEWANIVVWNRQAEIAEQYLKKGSPVYVEGKLETRSWDDKTTGEKKYRTEIRALNFQMLGGKSEGGTPVVQQSQRQQTAVIDTPPTDFLPF